MTVSAHSPAFAERPSCPRHGGGDGGYRSGGHGAINPSRRLECCRLSTRLCGGLSSSRNSNVGFENRFVGKFFQRGSLRRSADGSRVRAAASCAARRVIVGVAGEGRATPSDVAGVALPSQCRCRIFGLDRDHEENKCRVGDVAITCPIVALASDPSRPVAALRPLRGCRP
jgi:hypothetical protein